jgi:GT2 family glycosyltransferase
MPPLSIIIPTLNRAQILCRTVSQVLEQTFRDFDLWVIDQSDPDHAQEIVRHLEWLSDPRLHYAHIAVKNLPNARNEGIRRCTADIILFLDDDVILLTRDFLWAHIEAYRNRAVGGVTGRSVERYVTPNSRKTACHVGIGGRTIFNLLGLEAQPIGSCKGSNMSFRASVFREVGGFDRQTGLLEETDFSVRVARQGWLLLFEPGAELVHLSEPSGGVRMADELSPEVRRVRAEDKLGAEVRRFRSTAYFVLKHRGILGFVPFAATFSLIAMNRALRVKEFRSLGALHQLLEGVFDGYRKWQAGPDEAIIPATPQRDS